MQSKWKIGIGGNGESRESGASKLIVRRGVLWQSRGSKGKARPAPASDDYSEVHREISELRTELANLRDQMRVLNQILDGIREDLQWVTQNGIEVREPLGFRIPSPVLKAMALDPAGDDWGEKLDINHGLKSVRPDEPAMAVDEPRAAAEPTPNRSKAHQPASPTSPTPSPPRPRGSLF